MDKNGSQYYNMANNNPKIEGLIKYSKEKTSNTVTKVENQIRLMVKQQSKINFNTVSDQSGVSKAFLYKNESLRNRIDTLRKQQEGLPSAKQVKRQMSDPSKDVVIATLRLRIDKLEKENKLLKEQLNANLVKIYNNI